VSATVLSTHRSSPLRPRDFVFVALLLLIIGSSTLVNPFGRDQGGFAYAASAYIDGKTLYRDLFVDKPPMTYLLVAAGLKVFGSSMLSLRLLDWLWQCATGIAVFLIGYRVYGSKATGMLAALLYGLFYFSFAFKNTAQTDGFITLPLALGILAFLEAVEKKSSWRLFLAGMYVSIAFLFKYPIALLLGTFLVGYLVSRSADKNRYFSALYVICGFCLPILLFVTSLLVNHSLGDLYRIHGFLTIMNFGFRPFTPGFFFKMVSNDFRLLLFHWVFLIALIHMLKERVDFAQCLIFFWGFASIVHLVIQNKYFEYHALPTIAPQTIIASHLFLLAHKKAKALTPRLAMVASCLLAALLTFGYYHYGMFDKHRALASVLTGSTTLETIYASPAFDTEDFSMRSVLEVSDFVKNNSTEGEKIFVWGYESAVYFLAGRECASRFIYNVPLFESYDLKHYRRYFLQDLAINEPEMILIVTGDAIPWVTGTTEDSYGEFLKFSEFRNYVEENYQLVGPIRNFMTYKRKSP
jgi:hypothetical protein